MNEVKDLMVLCDVCRLRVALKPIGTGLYPSRILLTHTGGLDTRYVLHCI